MTFEEKTSLLETKNLELLQEQNILLEQELAFNSETKPFKQKLVKLRLELDTVKLYEALMDYNITLTELHERYQRALAFLKE